jgi:hypothetical protein
MVWFILDNIEKHLNKPKVMLLFLLGFALNINSISVIAQSSSFEDNIIPPGITKIRPDHDAKPVHVEIGIYIIDIIDVDDVNESFKADFLMDLKWQDPRLSEKSLGFSLEDYKFVLDEIWHPNINPVNLRGEINERDQDVDIDSEGIVRFSERIYGEFSSPLELNEFPFDVQYLMIQIASFEYGPQDVLFIVDSFRTGRVDGSFLAGWDIIENISNVDVDPLSGISGVHTRLVHSIVIDRHAGYYFWKFILPLCFIILMAWSVFWLDPEKYATSQIYISSATIFALIAFLISLRQILPRTSYLTRADELVLGATILVFLALAEVIITSRLSQNKKVKLARKIDKVGRWVYLLFFAILLLGTLFL